MSDRPDDFRASLELVLAGDPAAAEQFFVKYRRVVRLLAVGMLQRRVQVRIDESDIAQETMRKAVADLRQFRGCTEGQFVDWLKTVLRHTAQNLVRDHKAKRRNVDCTIHESYSSALVLAEKCVAPASDGPQHRAAQSELLVQLAWALGELTDNERLAVEMQQLQGMRVDDIATALGKTPVAATGLIYRGMKKLKRLMAEESSILSVSPSKQA